jgi:glutamate:GABA antiporter
LAANGSATATPHLKRVLGVWDLALLFIVAVTNLNVVPAIAANGPVTVWLWLLALLFFFLPQGIAVIELAHRFPGEGGVYLWTKEVFGDVHGFISGWCYWTNNVFYVPTVLLYLVGISVYIFGAQAHALADNKVAAFSISLAALWIIVALNVRGLGVGRWINNLGGLGTAITAVVLIGLGLLAYQKHGSLIGVSDFRLRGTDWRIIASFGYITFGLVGLELGSIMGDEIRDPRRTVPKAVVWGGIISGVLYVAATLAVLIDLPQKQIGVVQGILQAVSKMGSEIGAGWLVPPLALLLSISIAGIASAWLAGSARIPFVAGLDQYLPAALGKLHPRYATPYVALTVHGTLSTLFLAMNFIGASVQEAFLVMLDLAVFLQLVPFLYMYAALIRLATRRDANGVYDGWKLKLAGVCGFATTALGMGVAFVPTRQISSVWLFEAKMITGCAFFLGLAAFLFRFYSSRKSAHTMAVVGAAPQSGGFR